MSFNPVRRPAIVLLALLALVLSGLAFSPGVAAVDADVSAMLTGRVLDEGGRPVEGMVVTAAPPRSTTPAATAKSRADGGFELAVGGGLYVVAASDPDGTYAETLYRGGEPVEVGAGATKVLEPMTMRDVQGSSWGRVRGLVVDAGERPVSGITALAYESDESRFPVGRGQSNWHTQYGNHEETGVYTIDLPEGTYSIAFETSELDELVWYGGGKDVVVEVKAGQTTELNGTMVAPRPWDTGIELSGRAIGPDEKPLRGGVPLTLFQRYPSGTSFLFRDTTTTAADGTYSFDDAPTDRLLTVCIELGGSDWSCLGSRDLVSADYFRIPVGSKSFEAPGTVRDPRVEVTARVVEMDGSPVANETISLVPVAGPGQQYHAFSDGDGRMAWEGVVPRGRYVLCAVRHAPHACIAGQANASEVPFDIPVDQTSYEAPDLVLGRSAVVVTGRVAGSSGIPFSNAQVILFKLAGGGYEHAGYGTAGPDGSYRIATTAGGGTYTVCAMMPMSRCLGGAGDPARAATFEAAAGSRMSGKDIDLGPGVPVRGEVTLDGEPAQLGWVQLYSVGENTDGSSYAIPRHGAEVVAGNYELTAFETGQPLTVCVQDPSRSQVCLGGVDQPAAADTFTVRAGSDGYDVGEVIRLTSAPSCDGAVLTTGAISLGMTCDGSLGSDGVGLRLDETGHDAVIPGCVCEGWGVGDAKTQSWGGSHRESGSTNITRSSLQIVRGGAGVATGASSTVRVGRQFEVTHTYAPSVRPNVFNVAVRVKNIGSAPADLRYRRVVDWDVAPTQFKELVSVENVRAPELVFASNDGFASVNPFAGKTDRGARGRFDRVGPKDHGALLDFDLGRLPAGETKTFYALYGAAKTEELAIDDLRLLGARAWTLGQASGDASTKDTFFFAVSGEATIPLPNAQPQAAPDSLTVRNGGGGWVDVLLNDTDEDGDVLRLGTVTQPQHGTAGCGAEGCWYQHDGSEATEDSFTYVVADGRGGFDRGTVAVTIEPASAPKAWLYADGRARLSGVPRAGEPVSVEASWFAQGGQGGDEPTSVVPEDVEYTWYLDGVQQDEHTAEFTPATGDEGKYLEVALVAKKDGYWDGYTWAGDVIRGQDFKEIPLAVTVVTGQGNDQKAVEGAWTYACDVQGGRCYEGRSSADGTTTIRIPAGKASYDVWTYPPDGSLFSAHRRLDVDEESDGPTLLVTLTGPKPVPPAADPGPGFTQTTGQPPTGFAGTPATVVLTDCTVDAGTVPSWTVEFANGSPSMNGVLKAGAVGTYTAEIPPFTSSGQATFSTNVVCGSGETDEVEFSIYIDPSGFVTNQYGVPIAGATVTLERFVNGAFVAVRDEDAAVMDPDVNDQNPSRTDPTGYFRWDVAPGTYRVEAANTGCATMTSPAMQVPPERVDLLLKMTCSTGAAASTPTPLTGPKVTGDTKVGSKLTLTDGTWSNDIAQASVAWLRDGTPTGVTTKEYTLSAADQGKKITARVTARRPNKVQENGSGQVVTFEPFTVDIDTNVPAAPGTPGGGGGGGGGGGSTALVATADPTITGTAKVGRKLTASPGTWNGTDLTYSYAWSRGGTLIAGATGAEYVATADDVDQAITVTVTASKTGLTDGTATSAAVTVAKGDAPTATTPPAITGDAEPGGTLRVSSGTWSEPGVAFAYQWLVDGAPVSGATGTSYDVRPGDAGTQVSVRVTATKAGYGAGSATTEAVTIDDAPPPVTQAGSTTSATLAKDVVRAGKRAKLLVRVALDNGKPPLGRLVVRVDGRRVSEIALTRRAGGRAALSLPKLAVGKHTVRVRYLGNAAARASSSARLRLVVKQKRSSRPMPSMF
ncbi:hypothetical protein GGQ22_00670 [Nocardioides sp. zg-579]|uniref:Alpha-amylase n=1 Tax=Nocardioides marmotae TaxID=2663857 RepID=A0A6I3J415_9ACTN|nr:carboxypeptidase regulatory-like domain-containing protein [Nocardioides marmotae]MCR6029954.1 hypothetical protein [Gordonia jinghuaiqii]MTB93584.1 hypothetical protein [Nocardioides marmotae]QKD99950.1 hypothetical protein HPC71_01740 [Nocardioides marmotae]